MNKASFSDILFLSKTKNLNEFVLKELEPLNMECHFLVSPSASRGGGLALLWRSDVDLRILTSNPNFIDTMSPSKERLSSALSCTALRKSKIAREFGICSLISP